MTPTPDHPAPPVTAAEAHLGLAILDAIERSGVTLSSADRRRLARAICRRLMQEGYRV